MNTPLGSFSYVAIKDKLNLTLNRTSRQVSLMGS